MQAFEGIRILDLTRVLAGPYASYQFALLGADVIKIEPAGTGETTRWRSEGDAELGNAGMSPSFLAQGANKRSLTVDLDSAEGQQIFLRLVATSDVVLENLRTGSMDKRNIGYEHARRVKPDIIYCSATGYGQTGPKARYPAYDSVIQAAAGMMSVTGVPETGPVKTGPPVVDYAMGQAGAFAISAALFQCMRTGQGQHIDLSMYESCMALMTSMLTIYVNSGNAPGLRGNEAASRSPASTTFETKDGQLSIAINENHQFHNLVRALGHGDFVEDPRFKDAASRRGHTEFLRQTFGAALMTRPAAEWEVILNEAGVPAARVATLPEMMRDPQVIERGFFQKMSAEDTGVGRDLLLPLTAFRFKTDGPSLRKGPPRAGADNEDILKELGYAETEILSFKQRRVI
jgi:crotonobetainyl-CoA:carnitine CoA-transferase CaiB-like acyl-CoA transferase